MENGGIIGGKPMGGMPAMFGGIPGTGGMPTDGGIGGGRLPSIGGGRRVPEPIRPGELVPELAGSCMTTIHWLKSILNSHNLIVNIY